MSGKAFLNAIALGCWVFGSAIAFMIVAYASFLGIGVIGLMIWSVCARLDLERDSAVGIGGSPSFFARQVRTRAEMSPAERAAHRDQQSLEARSVRFFKHLGMALTVIGFLGFWLYQL
ncbi:MAG: hypothetical protein U1E60_05300 [Reyranellaceae bacterium]